MDKKYFPIAEVEEESCTGCIAEHNAKLCDELCEALPTGCFEGKVIYTDVDPNFNKFAIVYQDQDQPDPSCFLSNAATKEAALAEHLEFMGGEEGTFEVFYVLAGNNLTLE